MVEGTNHEVTFTYDILVTSLYLYLNTFLKTHSIIFKVIFSYISNKATAHFCLQYFCFLFKKERVFVNLIFWFYKSNLKNKVFTT